MANVKKIAGVSRVSTHLPAEAALVLIDRAVAADRSVSAYVADILMYVLAQKNRQLEPAPGGRRPRSDADPARTVNRVLKASRGRARARATQVAAQRRTATRSKA